MRIECSRPGCRSTFETPGPPRAQDYTLLEQHGWVRQAVTGQFIWYCAGDAPLRRPGALNSFAACGYDGCTGTPLMDFLGHDEAGHRAARRLLQHFAVQVQGGTPEERVAERRRIDETDLAIEMLTAMRDAELRKVAGLGPKSLARVRYVLGRQG